MDKALALFVTIYKAQYNYLVVIGTDVYEMSDNANMPNGVNMYSGTLTEHDVSDYETLPLSEATESLKIAIAYNIADDVVAAQNPD